MVKRTLALHTDGNVNNFKPILKLECSQGLDVFG